MVLVHYARRLLRPRQPPGDGTAGSGPRAGWPAGLLAELRRGPTVSRNDIPPAVQGIRLVVLAIVIATVPFARPHFGDGPRGIVLAVTLVISATAWLIWTFAGGRPRLWVAMLALMGLAGGVLAGVSSLSTAVAVGFVVTVSAGARLATAVSVAIVAETVAAFLVSAIVSGANLAAVIGWSCGVIGMWAFGLTRRAYLLRAEEAEQALEQARRAHAAETQAAALAERARIAREIHDVLAHALAAVSVNLQAAEGLLEAVPDKGPQLAKVVECVERAGALTKEGMAETRRAILALRDDAAGAPAGYASRPAAPGAAATDPAAERLTRRLRSLADEHRAAGDSAVELAVTGTPRPLGTDQALTAYRAAQEALTNARKHAPSEPVSLRVNYAPDEVTVEVSNPLPATGAEGPLARAGSGYGLTGLRERAALANGTLTAGPGDGRWTVRLTLPG